MATTRALDLNGKIAVVTGGSRGIGQAVASALAASGASVLACGRSKEALSRMTSTIAASLPSGTGCVESYVADVRDPAQMECLFAEAGERFGGLDIVVNNAGVGRFEQLVTQSMDDWREVIETNLLGVYFSCRAAVPALRRRGGGWIINISSLAGRHPFAGGSAYCASKAGLDALTEVLMQEVRHDDIRVSCVAPGSVSTRFAVQAENAENAENIDPRSAWKLDAADVAQLVIDLLGHDPRSLPSRVEIRPSRPRK